MFTARQKKIIQILLNMDEPVSGRTLADTAGVSDRTIRSDINVINSSFHGQISSGKDGYYIPLSFRNSFLKELQNDQLETNVLGNRPAFMLFELLWQETPITIDEISEIMFLSRSSIIKELRLLQNYIGHNDVCQMKKNHFGIQIVGQESAKRDLIGRFLFDSYEKNKISDVKAALVKMGIISNEDFIWIYDYLIACFNNMHISLTDRGMFLFTLEISIMLNRIKCGFCIEPDYTTHSSYLNLSFSFIEQRFGISISALERAYVSDRMAKRNQINISSSASSEANLAIQEFLQDLQNNYGISMDALKPYRKGLESHLTAMIDRLSNHITSDATMINEIRVLYPYAFECSTAIIPIVKKELNLTVSEAEISYIAVHLAVILDNIKRKRKALILCSSGVGTGMLIKRRLENQYADKLEIIGPFPVYQLDNVLKKTKDFDVIITTVPLTRNLNIPVLLISPLFTDKDQNKLQQFVETHQSVHKSNNQVHVLRKDLFYQFSSGFSDTDILKTMAHGLWQHGMIVDEKAFVHSIKDRDALYSTVYGRIWLPHPMNAMAVKDGIAVAVLKENKNVDLVFMLAVPREDTSLFSSFYDRILLMMDQPEWIEKLKNAQSFEEFEKTYDSMH